MQASIYAKINALLAENSDITVTPNCAIFIDGQFYDQVPSDYDLYRRLCELTGALVDFGIDPCKQSGDEVKIVPGAAGDPVFKRYFKLKPFNHQLAAVTLSRDEIAYFYAMEQGTGKTATALANAAYLYEEGRIDCVLIVAPKGVHHEWAAVAAAEHLPVDHVAAHWSANMKREQRDKWEWATRSGHGLKILAMNIEGISASARSYPEALRILKENRTLFIVDESTGIKTSSAQRTKKILKLGKFAAYRRCLSGTPVTRGPLDVYTQYEFLQPGFWATAGFGSYSAFRNYFAIIREDRTPSGKFMSFPVGYRNLDLLAKLIAPITYRVLAKDCLDLPPLIKQVEKVTLTKVQKDIYKQVKDNLFVELAQGEITVDHLLTKLIRLSQVAGGFVKLDEDSDPTPIDGENPKLNRLMEVINNTDDTSKIIIWANFTHEIVMLSNALVHEYGNDSVVTYYGETSDDDRTSAKDAFRAGTHSPARFFVGNPRAGGIGLNLTAAQYMVYYSNGYDLLVRLQSEKRFDRLGQVNSQIILIDIVAEATIDENVVTLLNEKKKLADVINQDNVVDMV